MKRYLTALWSRFTRINILLILISTHYVLDEGFESTGNFILHSSIIFVLYATVCMGFRHLYENGQKYADWVNWRVLFPTITWFQHVGGYFVLTILTCWDEEYFEERRLYDERGYAIYQEIINDYHGDRVMGSPAVAHRRHK